MAGGFLGMMKTMMPDIIQGAVGFASSHAQTTLNSFAEEFTPRMFGKTFNYLNQVRAADLMEYVEY